MAKSTNRERVSLECPECSNRNYRLSRKTKGTYKLDLKKYCPTCRKHVEHKEKKK
jgi:large subunit ribosomal protein L33